MATPGLLYTTEVAVKEHLSALLVPITPQVVAITVLAVMVGVCIVDAGRFAYYMYKGLNTGKFNFYSWTVLKAIAKAWTLREKFMRQTMDDMGGIDPTKVMDTIAEAMVKYET